MDLEALLGISDLEIKKQLFKIRDFDFITITDKGQNKKQDAALEALTCGKYREVLYGGAAGGAKSWTGASWLTFMCELYPGTRWFVGREELKRAKESTYVTFLKVFKAYGIEGVRYNANDHYLLFDNGSRIDFIELKFYPSDPYYERFGSVEYTGGWIEEGGEINFGAFDVLKTRIGRHLNDQYGLRPVLFITCNPKKNWLYMEFYVPFIKSTLPITRVYIPALVQDNPNIEADYIAQLQSVKDKAKRERLLEGNWEYDDDPASLCDFDAINDLFTNEVSDPDRTGRISADLAMKGRDRFIAGLWRGLIVKVAIDQELSTGKSIETDLKKLMSEFHIGHSQTVVDSDGLGAYLESYLTGIQEFHGGAKAFDEKEYANLKSECAYKLAELINKRMIKIICTPEQREKIMQEVALLKSQDVDGDEKRKRIIDKKKMKEDLRRSPDYLDMLIMGMYFLVKPKKYFGY
jgi:phage terminase large subunit